MKKLYVLLLFVMPLFGFSQVLTVGATNLTVECDGSGNISDLNNWLASNGSAQATASCGNLTWSNNFTALSDDCGNTGSATVIFTATDDCGFVTTTATFTIQDTIQPNFSFVPLNVTVLCDGTGNTAELSAWYASLDGIEVQESCTNSTILTVYDGVPPTDCNETTVISVTYTAIDECGNVNTATSTFTFQVDDCPQGNVILTTQLEINNFAIQYPNCDSIQGYLAISGFDIVDLTPLSQINSVGSLLLSFDPALQSIQGLDALTISGLTTEDSFIVIDNIPLLQDISFLNNYTVNDQVVFIIRDMPLLTSLDGAGNITEFAAIYLGNNDALISLDGLNQNLNIVGGLVQPPVIYIGDNAILSDISRLNTSQFNDVLTAEIINNPQLAVCENNLICTVVANGNATIENNGQGCNSTVQVSQACGLVPSNDDCEGAIEITFGNSTESYNDFATTSPQIPSCNDENRVDVWFKFNSLNIPAISILTTSGYNMQLWVGTCDALTQVENACAAGILQDIAVSANTDYHIQIWSDGTGRLATGLFDILVQDAALSVSENVFDSFSIFPNPVNNLLNLKSNQKIDELQVYNVLGQKVLSSKPKTLQTQLNMMDLNSGLYLLKVTIDNQTQTYKIIKE